MSIAVFPDTTVFCNFAAVGKSDLLGEFLRDRGRWTEAVMSEVEQSRGYLPDLQRVLEGGWMGEPIVLDSTDEIGQVERIGIFARRRCLHLRLRFVRPRLGGLQALLHIAHGGEVLIEARLVCAAQVAAKAVGVYG